MHAAAAQTPEPASSADLLLRDLDAVAALDAERPTARARLDEALGPELASLLVGALRPERGAPPLRALPA
jgi:hypothetical protein